MKTYGRERGKNDENTVRHTSPVHTHLLAHVQFPRHAVVREIRIDRRIQQLGRLPVFGLLRRRLYSRLRARAVEFRRFVNVVRFAVVVAHLVTRHRVPEHVLLVLAGHGLYRSRGPGVVLLPKNVGSG